MRQFVDNYDSISVEGVSKEDLEKLNALINENIEFVDEEQSPEQGEGANAENNAADEEEYFCPECGAKITLDMTHCPKCGVEFEFQEDEE